MKVLIVSQNSLSLHANNGKTLAGIFQGFDSDSLAQIYFQDEIPESEQFKRFFRVRDVDLLKKRLFLSKRSGQAVSPQRRVLNHHQGKSRFSLSLIRILKKFDRTKIFLRDSLYSGNSWVSEDLERWILDFGPDAIFLLPSNYSLIFDFSLFIKNRFDIPLYSYYTDDYLGGSDVTNRYKAKALAVMAVSSGRFVIGEEMARVYKGRYGFDFSILINPVSTVDIKRISPQHFISDEVRIAYAGGLTLGRYEALLNFSHIVKLCSSWSDKKITLVVCSGDSVDEEQRQVMRQCGISFLGKLDSVRVQLLYEKASYLLHVESNLPHHIDKTRLSVSTKIPECLAKGNCLIAFGPAGVASMKLIYENDIGIYLNASDDIAASARALHSVLLDPVRSASFAQKGAKYAQENFSYAAISGNLIDVITREGSS